MYFWNVEKLAADLRERKLTQKDKMKYLVAFSLYYVVLVEVILWSGIFYSANSYDVIISLINIAATIIGILVCFQANEKGDQQDFIERFTCISFPITNRFLVIYFGFFSLYFIFGSLILGEAFDKFVQSTNIMDVITPLIFMILYYYYIKKYIAKIARSE